MYLLNDVGKRYGDITALKSTTCEIATNSFTFIIGPSGAGKSTLLRLLSFVESPDVGTVSLQLDGTTFDSGARARPWPRLTCVFQKQFLWPHLTLRDNIELPLRARRVTDLERRVRGVVDLLDMSDFVDRFPNQVSGGQAQRGALARALALEPQLILIDEPHGGLDLEQQEIFNMHLISLRAIGVGLIVVTHSIGFAHRYADQVIVVENGSVSILRSIKCLDRPSSPFLQRVAKLSKGHGRP